LSGVVFGLVWVALGLVGLPPALIRALHPRDYQGRWRWVNWGGDPVRYRGLPVERRSQMAKIEAAFWSFGLAAGVVYTLVEVLK
jgi:hypothetical protein